MNFPDDLQYTKDHEWVKEAGKELTIGVSAFAINQLGDVVHIDLPELGETFAQGESFGTIESTKTVSDLYMPVSGTVGAINEALLEAPQTLQNDPYKGGWLIKVTSQEGSQELLSSQEYTTYLKEHEVH